MDILEVCKVIPNVSCSQFSLPLTFLDTFWLRLDPASRLFFYEFTQPITDFLEILLPKLKNSLSLALQHYLPLAGKQTWPQDSVKPIIQYRFGDGISLTVAETQADFEYFSGDNFRESSELYSLLPNFPTSETENPVMTLQITLFPNKGFSIGYVANHSVMDGKSVSLFMHTWAYICKNGEDSILPPELTPFFDRTFVKHHTELEKIYLRVIRENIDPESKALMKFDMKPPPDTMLGTFRLTRENIDTLKKSVFTYWKENDVTKETTHLSTFTVTCAYVLVCLTKAKTITTKKTFIGINIDFRSRLDPPLPPTYFGNCVLGCGCGRDTEETTSGDGFFLAVGDLIEALALLNYEAVKMAENLNSIISSMSKDFVCFVAGSPRFELYKVDFGWGVPRKVEMISIAKSGAIYLSDTRASNGGIEIGVVLRRDETKKFASLFVSGIQSC